MKGRPFVQIVWISSSVRFLVTGRRNQIYRYERTQSIAYPRNTLGAEKSRIRLRKVAVTTETASHSATVATDTARPRMRFGNNSARHTHTPGPSPKAKQAT